MNYKDYSDESKKLISRYYDYLSYLEYCQNTKRSKEHEYRSSESKDKEWTGSKSLEEAFHHATYGWDAGIKQLKEVVATLEIEGALHPRFDVVGAYPDIPRYLSNVPDSMITFKDPVQRNKKRLCLFISSSYNCGNSKKSALNYCAKLIHYINNKNKEYDLKLITVFTCTGLKRGYKELIAVLIKDYDEPLVLNSIAYAMHPSYLRRIHFKHLETTTMCIDGYGQPVSNGGTKEVIKFIKDSPLVKDNFSSDKRIFLPVLNDKMVRMSAKKFLEQGIEF